MFQKRSLLVFSVVSLLAISLAIYLFSVKERDKQSYHELMKSSEPVKYDTANLNKKGWQKRHNVTKEMWFQKDGNPLYFYLHSEDSEVIVEQKRNSLLLQENMRVVEGYFQEQRYFALGDGTLLEERNGQLFLPKTEDSVDPSMVIPMQKIRYFTAKKATQFYETNQLIASDVYIKTFIAQGHELSFPLEESLVIMEGTLDTLTIYLNHSEPKLRSKNLHATFYSKKESP